MSKLSKKPIIALDIDDVLVHSAADIIGNYNRRWSTQLDLRHFYAVHDDAAWGGVDEDTAIERVNEYVLSPEFVDRDPIPKVIHSLLELSQHYELHALTGRSSLISQMTKDWLERHFPAVFSSVNFSDLFHKEKTRSKGDMCVEMGAVALIDDGLAHAISAVDHGIRAILFGDYPWNQADTLPEGVTRCVDWPAVLQYFEQEKSRV